MTALSFNDLKTLTVNIDSAIAHIELSRPEALNSMIAEFWQELPDVVRRIDQHAAARVIVISSQGKHFSAGMDLSVFANMAANYQGEPARCAERIRRQILKLQDTFTALEEARMPILVAMQGGVIGGAVDMACACDSRYCTEEAFFTIKETQIGMTADVGTLQRLPRLIPQGLAKELAYTGRNMPSSEALACGFVNQVFADQQSMLDHVMTVAEQIAANSPVAVAGCKEMLNYSRENTTLNSLTYMATWQSGMFQMPDIQEAIQAQKEKRQPQFDDLHTQFHAMTSN